MKFTELGLSEELQRVVAEQGYKTPSPIQAQAIPLILKGKDVMAAAQTGTGKTAGFTLPILEILSKGQKVKSNRARVLILTPTRELAAQVEDSVKTYSKYLKLNSTVVFGGVKINPQMQRLRKGVDILVATPGRLLDLHNQNAVRFDDLEVLVLDEADRMLDMGFIHDIKRIIKLLPHKRQNLLFSATFSKDIRKLAQSFTNNPVEISVNPENTTAENVSHVIHPVDKKRKPELLMHLVADGQWQQVLVFCRTKRGANKLAEYLIKYGINSAAIHGNKSQGARTKALAGFKAGNTRVLVATDIAARGIDIDQLPHVVNVDLPNVPEDYVHRIGRTGRAGESGHAVSLVSADEYEQLFDIEKLIGKKLKREYVDDFEPIHDVPASRADAKHIPKPKQKQKQKSKPRNNSNRKPNRQRTDNKKPSEKRRNANRSESRSIKNKDPDVHNATGASPWAQSEDKKKKKPKKPKKRPFVKAAVKEKWANRSEEENQAARANSPHAKRKAASNSWKKNSSNKPKSNFSNKKSTPKSDSSKPSRKQKPKSSDSKSKKSFWDR